MIPGDLLSAFPHRQFHTLPGLLDSWAALPNSYPNALRAMQGGSLCHFSHPPKRMRVTYASGIRPASASTLSTSMKPLHGIISYCTCIFV